MKAMDSKPSCVVKKLSSHFLIDNNNECNTFIKIINVLIRRSSPDVLEVLTCSKYEKSLLTCYELTKLVTYVFVSYYPFAI